MTSVSESSAVNQATGGTEVLRPHDGTRPEIRVECRDGQRVVAKDYSPGKWSLRLIGRVLVPRECRAYDKLAGLPGIPRVVARDRLSLTLEYLEGTMLSFVDPTTLTAGFYNQLYELIRAMHARGVTHGDLKRLNNVIVGPDGRPSLIDFSAAFTANANPVTGLIMRCLRDDDLRSVGKAKRRFSPELLTPEEEHLLDHMHPAARAARWVLKGLRRLVQILAGRESYKP